MHTLFFLLFACCAFAISTLQVPETCAHSATYWAANPTEIPSTVPTELCGLPREDLLLGAAGDSELRLYAKHWLATDANIRSAQTNPDELAAGSFLSSVTALQCYTERSQLLDERCADFPLARYSDERQALIACAELLAEESEGMHDTEACAESVELVDSAADIARIADRQELALADESVVQSQSSFSTATVVGIAVLVFVLGIVLVLWIGCSEQIAAAVRFS